MSGSSNGVRVISCEPGPEPKKLTARARSQNLKQHMEGFLSVNMTDQNADMVEYLAAMNKPFVETYDDAKEKHDRFYLHLLTMRNEKTFIKRERAIQIIQEANEIFPNFVKPEVMCEIAAIILGYNSYKQMEERSFFGSYMILGRMTLDSLMNILKSGPTKKMVKKEQREEARSKI